MNTFEILKENITIPKKDLADKLGMSKESLYKWLDGSNKSPLDRLEVILDNSDSSAILDYLCQREGGYYMHTHSKNVKVSSICAQACKEFGELLAVISNSIEDDVVTRRELSQIQKEWNDLLNLMQSFLREKADILKQDVTL